jgi:DNA-binding CsgD family transcriptional regulator/tetratricopeptide (TPR) repeat protein
MRSAGRSALLEQLNGLVDAASAGQGRVVVVSGEAGIGKTTLAESLAAARPERRLWGACEPLTTTSPLLPLHDWARMLGEPLPGGDRHEAFTRTLDLIGQEPTVAVVEDVHWADDGTLDLLVFLGRRVATLPVTLVLTTRDDESTSSRVTDVLRHLGSLPGSQRVVVPPLTDDEVEELTAGTGLDAARVRAITGGNAFFVSQLVEAPDVGVPDSVRATVLARLSPLSASSRRAVEVVAVIPDRAALDLVYAAAPASPADLEEAERAGVLTSDGRTVGFRHELAREAVEESLPGARRQACHRAVLDQLTAGANHAEIAYHADLAGDHARAIAHGLTAAETSLRHGARRQACVQLSRARRHLAYAEPGQAIALLRAQAGAAAGIGDHGTAVPTSEEAVAAARALADPDLLAGQLARHALLIWRIGGGALAQTFVDEALEVGAATPEGEGNLWALLAESRMRMLSRHIDASLEIGRRAVALARTRGDQRALADALHTLGTASWFAESDQADEAEPLLRQALVLARRLEDDHLVALILINLGSSAGEVRRYGQAQHWLEESLAFCTARDLDFHSGYVRAWLGRIALEQGEFARATELATRCLDSHDLIAQIGGLTILGRVGLRQGVRDARERLDTAWSLAEPTGDLQRTWPVAAGQAEHAFGAGDPPPASLPTVFAQAVELRLPWAVGELGWWMVRTGQLAAGDPRLASAAGPYAALLRDDFAGAARLWEELGCRYDAALARGLTDDPEEIAGAIGVLDELGARSDADRLAARLRQLDGRPVRRVRRATAAHPFGLTARELEVLALLRDGLTNAEIAERTFTSVKTAGHHVSAILTKLGVSSRRDAVRASAELWDEPGR